MRVSATQFKINRSDGTHKEVDATVDTYLDEAVIECETPLSSADRIIFVADFLENSPGIEPSGLHYFERRQEGGGNAYKQIGFEWDPGEQLRETQKPMGAASELAASKAFIEMLREGAENRCQKQSAGQEWALRSTMPIERD